MTAAAPVAPASDEVIAEWETDLADDYTAEELLRRVSYDEARSIIARLRLEMARNAGEPPPGT